MEWTSLVSSSDHHSIIIIIIIIHAPLIKINVHTRESFAWVMLIFTPLKGNSLYQNRFFTSASNSMWSTMWWKIFLSHLPSMKGFNRKFKDYFNCIIKTNRQDNGMVIEGVGVDSNIPVELKITPFCFCFFVLPSRNAQDKKCKFYFLIEI